MRHLFPGMPLPLLRSLIWLDYGSQCFSRWLPLVLLFWRSPGVSRLVRLFTLYWQVASLLGIRCC